MKRNLRFNFTRMLPGILLSFFTLVGIGKASAYDFEVDGIFYNIISESPAEVEVTYGDSYYVGEIIIPSSIEYNSKTYSVGGVGMLAFYECPSLTSVDLPYSITSIGENAFQYCPSLTSIGVSEKNEIYSSLDGVLYNKDYTTLICCPGGKDSVFLSDNLTYIGDNAFVGCSSLTSIKLPDSVTSIGDYAFGYCESLTSIEFPDYLMSIGVSAFSHCTSLPSINLPDYLISIGYYAFEGCFSLTSIEVSENNPCYSSLDGVLYDKYYTTIIRCPCKKTSVSLPSSVTSIRNSAFSYCESLISLSLPKSLTNIENYAFQNCTSLISIDLPDSVTSIGSSAFECCFSLASIKLPESLTSIDGTAFVACESLTSINLPASLTFIDGSAFLACFSLTSIEVAENNKFYSSLDGVLYNKDYTTLVCFPGGKEKVDLPDSLTSIGYWAFSYCESVTAIDLPNSITTIEDHAFFFCTSLSSVTCESLVVPEIGYECFFGISPDAVLYVYENVLEDYQNSDWAQYFSNIAPMEFIPVSSISISPNPTQEIKIGQEVEFTATVLPANASIGKVNWSVSNPETVSLQISETNPNVAIITGIAGGEATVTAKSVDGTDITANVNIMVSDVGTGISGIAADSEGRYTVYTMSGILVKVLNDPSEFSQLEKGAYIINGTKTVIK